MALKKSAPRRTLKEFVCGAGLEAFACGAGKERPQTDIKRVCLFVALALRPSLVALALRPSLVALKKSAPQTDIKRVCLWRWP